MQRRRPRTAEKFLSLRRVLAASPDERLVDELDESIQYLVENDPDQGELVLRALAESKDIDDRDTAAINVCFLFRFRPAAAHEILVQLARDPHPDVQNQARERARDFIPDLMLHSRNADVTSHALAAFDELTRPYRH